MQSSVSSGLYHVVCRECRVERLFDREHDALALERDHSEEANHRVVVEKVS